MSSTTKNRKSAGRFGEDDQDESLHAPTKSETAKKDHALSTALTNDNPKYAAALHLSPAMASNDEYPEEKSSSQHQDYEAANNPKGNHKKLMVETTHRQRRNRARDNMWDDDSISCNDTDDEDDEERPGANMIEGVGTPRTETHPVGDNISDDPMVNAELVDQDAERQEAMDEILAKTVQAEAVSPALLRRRRRQLLCGGCVVFCLVGGVGALLGVLLRKQDSNSAAASKSTTIQPSVSMAPSFSPSSSPSSSPTVFHDECETSRLVPTLPFFYSGTTELVGELGENSPATNCPQMSSFDRGVWFQADGTGGCMSASVTGKNFQSMVAIYAGTCGADDGKLLGCVTAQEGEAEWTSQLDQKYYILVSGVASAAGEYSLAVSDIGSICNNICQEPVSIHTLPFSFSGTTERAPSVDPDGGATSCLLDLVDFTTSGVWFSISLPEDSCINVSTKGSELDTILALYEGDCSNLTCITGTDDSDPDLSTEILFRAQANKQYRMLVGNAAFAGQGNFTVNVTAPEDDVCGEKYHGWVCQYEPNALGQQDYSCLYYEEGGSYPFQDRASFVIATCSEYPFAEPTPENCNCFVVLSDVAEEASLNDICTVCSFHSQSNAPDGEWDISFDCSNILSGTCVGRTEEGECISNEVADPIFDLPELSCSNATQKNIPSLSTGAFDLFSPFLEADTDAFACSEVQPFTYIVWYSAIGTGSCLRATTKGSEIDTKLAVYTGGCSSLSCHRQDDDDDAAFASLQSRVEWFANEGQEYHILLHTYDLLQWGNYILEISEFNCSSDIPCANSIEIDELPYLASGTTTGRWVEAQDSQALSCSLVKPGSSGIWYSGQTVFDNYCITVSTAGSQFDTVLAVYTGSCTQLTCLVENDNASELVRSSEVSWTLEFEKLYYVFVGGVDQNASGDYRVAVSINEGPCL